MEWSWPLFVRITRYDLGWSKACGNWDELLHPEQPRAEQPKPATAVVSVVAAAVVPACDGDAKAPSVARVAAKVTPVGAKAMRVAAVPAPAVKRVAASAPVAVAAAPAPTTVATATPVTAIATAHAKATGPSTASPVKTSPGLGLPQFLVMLEVPGGQVCHVLQLVLQ